MFIAGAVMLPSSACLGLTQRHLQLAVFTVPEHLAFPLTFSGFLSPPGSR